MASGVSSATLLNLNAEVLKIQESVNKNKAAGRVVVGGIKRPDKKPSRWMMSNAGVQGRAARDILYEEENKLDVDARIARLRVKAKAYGKMKKGKSGGYSEEQRKNFLTDFDRMSPDLYESGSDDEDESLTVPERPSGIDDDPIIEYVDELGRTRTSRRSDVPPEFLPDAVRDDDHKDDSDAIYNVEGWFPTYEPDADRQRAIKEKFAEDENTNTHYDATREVRTKGAAYYQFSPDESTRGQQQKNIAEIHGEARQIREELKAKDERVEGMQAEESNAASAKSLAMAKRKRDLEERRKAVEAKRRKKGKEDDSANKSASPAPMPGSADRTGVPPPPSSDPFAMLESQNRNTQSELGNPLLQAADELLAQVEQQMLKGKAR
ncbi:hypothetical protein C8Q76DRAFT_798774 [Earliella scabrosa]|nr:hypothetical protein C8Q76DRAFT_798774 [Earliella scabrosa]